MHNLLPYCSSKRLKHRSSILAFNMSDEAVNKLSQLRSICKNHRPRQQCRARKHLTTIRWLQAKLFTESYKLCKCRRSNRRSKVVLLLASCLSDYPQTTMHAFTFQASNNFLFIKVHWHRHNIGFEPGLRRAKLDGEWESAPTRVQLTPGTAATSGSELKRL